MLKFVQKWIREINENSEIKEEGTAEKWTKPEDGLPSSDRSVEVILYNPGQRIYRENTKAGMDLAVAQFNPHVGWKMDRAGVVVAWRDLDKEYRALFNDLEWANLSLSHKV